MLETKCVMYHTQPYDCKRDCREFDFHLHTHTGNDLIFSISRCSNNTKRVKLYHLTVLKTPSVGYSVKLITYYITIPQLRKQLHLLSSLLQLLLLDEQSIQKVLVFSPLPVLPSSTWVQLSYEGGVLTTSLTFLLEVNY